MELRWWSAPAWIRPGNEDLSAPPQDPLWTAPMIMEGLKEGGAGGGGGAEGERSEVYN